MARKLRVQYPGAIYHLLSRGDRRKPIFKDHQDRRCFMECLAEVCGKTGWQVHAYCLMPNHFHLVIETPQANLVVGMKWLLGTFTGRFNRRHKVSGHLFSGRYKSLIVDGSGRGYLKTVCDYVHLNPVRARMIPPKAKLARFPWSSFRHYLTPARKRPPWLRVDRLLGEHGIPRDTPAGLRQFAAAMEGRRASEDGRELSSVRRGWCLGERAFRKELLGRMRERRGPNHYGEERRESDEEKARQILRSELERRGWTEAALRMRRKGDKEKVELARRLRRETTMTLKWIAEHLAMGSWTHVSNLLATKGRAKRK